MMDLTTFFSQQSVGTTYDIQLDGETIGTGNFSELSSNNVVFESKSVVNFSIQSDGDGIQSFSFNGISGSLNGSLSGGKFLIVDASTIAAETVHAFFARTGDANTGVNVISRTSTESYTIAGQ